MSKSFGAVRVLDAIDLVLPPATILALLGTNGAGKSTLIKIIAGIYSADAGEMVLNGTPVRFATPRDAIEHGVSLLPQETSVIPGLSVAENILLGQLPVRRGRVDRAAMTARARELLEHVGLSIDPATPAERLSVQELRLVEIARALSGNASVLILDEPTASLNEVESEHLFVQLEKLRQSGTSIIYISHYLDEVFTIADTIAVLRDGRVMGQFAPGTASERDVLEAMLGRTLDHLFPETTTEAPGETILHLEQATLPGMAPLDLTVARGEVVGVFGLLGSGYDRIGPELFAGRPRLAAGRIAWKGATMAATPAARIASGMGFVPAERKRDGIIPERGVIDNVCLPSLRRFDRGLRLDHAAMRAFTAREISRLSIKCDGPEQEIRELSGGNQQKACLARWIDAGFELIVMEEPTRGVDLGARADIYRQIRNYTRGGGAVLLISSDVEEVAGMADRSVVFEGGAIVAGFPRGTDKAELMAAAARGTR